MYASSGRSGARGGKWRQERSRHQEAEARHEAGSIEAADQGIQIEAHKKLVQAEGLENRGGAKAANRARPLSVPPLLSMAV